MIKSKVMFYFSLAWLGCSVIQIVLTISKPTIANIVVCISCILLCLITLTQALIIKPFQYELGVIYCLLGCALIISATSEQQKLFGLIISVSGVINFLNWKLKSYLK